MLADPGARRERLEATSTVDGRLAVGAGLVDPLGCSAEALLVRLASHTCHSRRRDWRV
jgi:hypothetical protein